MAVLSGFVHNYMAFIDKKYIHSIHIPLIVLPVLSKGPQLHMQDELANAKKS